MFIKPLSFSIVSLALAVLLVGCNLPTPPAGSGAVTSGGACANPLYPVSTGSTWDYQMSGTTSGTFTRTILASDDHSFTDQDTFTNNTSRSGIWNCDAGNLIALDPTGGASANAQVNGNGTDFQSTAQSGVTLPAHVESGDTWSQALTLHGTMVVGGQSAEATNEIFLTCTASGSEGVSVPAGTFDAMKVNCQNNLLITVTLAGTTIPTNLVFETDSWYAPGVGLVKSVSSGSNINTTVELTSYALQ